MTIPVTQIFTGGFKGGGKGAMLPQDAFNCESRQLLGDFVPQTLYWGSAPGLRWGTPVPQTP